MELTLKMESYNFFGLIGCKQPARYRTTQLFFYRVKIGKNSSTRFKTASLWGVQLSPKVVTWVPGTINMWPTGRCEMLSIFLLCVKLCMKYKFNLFTSWKLSIYTIKMRKRKLSIKNQIHQLGFAVSAKIKYLYFIVWKFTKSLQ